MAIDVTCWCGQKLRAKDELAGKRVKCPKCGAALNIPAAAEDEYGLAELEPLAEPAPARPATPVRQGTASSRPMPGVARPNNPMQSFQPEPTRRAAPSYKGTVIATAVGGIAILAVMVVIALIVANKNGAGIGGAGDTKSVVAAETVVAPTEEEAQEFARNLEAELKRGNISGFDTRVDWEMMLSRTFDGMEVSDQIRKQLLTGLYNPHTGSELGKNLAQLRNDGTYEFLRTREVDGQLRVLFRMNSESLGLNYHEYVLHRSRSGKVLAADIYVYAAGEMMSAVWRRLFMPLVAAQSRTFLERLTGTDRELIDYQRHIAQIGTAASSRNFPEVLRVYRELPTNLQHEKSIMLLRIMAATQLSDYGELLAAIDQFEKLFPGDPALKLMSIDAYFLRGEHDKAMATVDALNELVGGDPYLSELKQQMEAMRNLEQ